MVELLSPNLRGKVISEFGGRRLFEFEDIHGLGRQLGGDAVVDDEETSERWHEATNRVLRRQGGGECNRAMRRGHRWRGV